MATFENAESAFATSLTNGTMPRWQRKAMNQSFPNTPSRGASTPGKACRFIPNRSAMNLDACHFNLTAASSQDDEATGSPSKIENQRNLKSNLMEGKDGAKILAFKQEAPKPKAGFQSLKVLYSQNKTGSEKMKKVTRHIPQTADRILDAPELRADFYLNLLAWSSTNVIAVGLGETVYLWNAANGAISELCTLEIEEDYICSVPWQAEGTYLAIGTASAEVQIWDAVECKKLRTMLGHTDRVSSLAWNGNILTSGSKSGEIVNHNVSIAEHKIASMKVHSQEVCGLAWSPCGKFLASGGNDNLVCIWNADGELMHTLNQHQAAVKALAWCPWQSNLLATGGGSADRTIKFWNTTTGACVNSVDTKSQVSSLLWNREHKELISGHGFAQNQLTIWKYPTMTKVAELTGHSQRVLSMAMSPDGTTVVSAAGDETLRFWKCFASDGKSKKKTTSNTSSRLSAMIR